MSRLDTFIEELKEALQPHGGCQCGCAITVLGAVRRAEKKLLERDEEAEAIEDQALDDALYDNRYGTGED